MKADFICETCELGLLDTEEHAKICEGQAEERIGLDLDQLEYTVEFFTWILKEKGADSGAGPGAAVQETPRAGQWRLRLELGRLYSSRCSTDNRQTFGCGRYS